MKLGILRADYIGSEYSDEFGDYPDMFRDLLKAYVPNLEIIVYEIRNGEYPDNIDEVDAYLLTGSKDGAYDDLEWFPRLTQFICELDIKRKKLIGICFGHQFIAQALGGKVEKSSKGWGLGRHSAKIAGSDDVFSIGVHHQDQVIVPAKDAVIVAGSEFCLISACAIGEHILTFQGHPEFTREFTKKLIEGSRKNLGEEVSKQGLDSLEDAFDTEFVAKWIAGVICK